MGDLGEEIQRLEGKDGKKKYMDSVYVLKVELKDLADRLTLKYKRKRNQGQCLYFWLG